MNYQLHYDRLISRARGRVLLGYVERHHVLPRCMGGGNANGNIVNLTAEEHFVAHQLLVKIYPEKKSLIHAAWWLLSQKARTNRVYGWLRRTHAQAMSDRMRGVKKSNECRAKISAQKTGKKNPRTPEWTAKIAAANVGRKHSEATRAMMSERQIGNTHNLGRKFTAEHRAKISAHHVGFKGKTGIPKSGEHKQKISAALIGRHLSKETRQKISDARRWKKGHPLSQENKEKMAVALKKYWESRRAS